VKFFLRKKCVWVEKLIFYDALIEKAYNTSCNEKERLVSKGREWVYCPWCGKKIEVKK